MTELTSAEAWGAYRDAHYRAHHSGLVGISETKAETAEMDAVHAYAALCVAEALADPLVLLEGLAKRGAEGNALVRLYLPDEDGKPITREEAAALLTGKGDEHDA